nr:S41 family peptidase [Massilia oculi]
MSCFRVVRPLLISSILACVALPATAGAPAANAQAAASNTQTQSRLTVAQARADLDALFDTLEAAHYDLYAYRSREQYRAAFRTARASLTDPMTRLDLVRVMQPLVAFGRIGHARLEFPVSEYIAAAQQGGTVLPFDIRVEGERVFVTHSYLPGTSIAPGAELLGLDGAPASALVAEVSRFVSAERPYMVNAQLERYFPRWLWLIKGEIRDMEVRGLDPQGIPFIARVSGLPIMQVEPRKSAWTEVLASRDVKLIDARTAYLRPGPFFEEGKNPMDTGRFREFIDAAFARILEAGSQRVLVDLRANPGGDNSFSDLMVAWFADRPFRFSDDFSIKASPALRRQFERSLADKQDQTGIVTRMAGLIAARKDGDTVRVELPKASVRQPRFTGQVYVLVDRHSYSNATSVAAMIQDYGFGKVIGEETADVPTSYASSASFTLPHSGISVTYPKGYFVRPNGDRSVRGVLPDLRIAPEFMHQDPATVLDAALALIERDQNQGPAQ